jgi:3-oxoacyl-[acyl-carrier protein] reductase
MKSLVWFITGASRGFGLEIARAALQRGDTVVAAARDPKVVERALDQSEQLLAVELDVTDEREAQAAVNVALARFGQIDVLVNNAGTGAFTPLVDMDRETFERTFATNVTGAMLMAREAARHFIERSEGNIVNICSTAGLKGAPRGTAYYASKFALRGMTECWRSELRAHNVRVFLINPSEVITQFALAAGFEQKDNPRKLHGEDIAHMVRSVLEMNDRGFTTELTVFATNPGD